MAKQDKQAPTEGNEIKTAADLKQDGNNYRKHSDTNKARIKKSIDEAGLGRSVVVDADGVLIAGNGVQQVVDPDTPVRVIETDGTELVVVKRTDLHTDDPRRKTLALADNATSDDVEWDTAAMEADGWDADSAGEWGVVAFEDEESGYEEQEQCEKKEKQNRNKIDEAVEKLLNEAMRENVRESLAQIEYTMQRGWLSTFLTKGLAQAKFIRAKFYGEHYPQWMSLYFCPQRFWTSASKLSPFSRMDLIRNGKTDAGIAGLRTLSGDHLLLLILLKGSYPFGGARMPIDFPANTAADLIREFAPADAAVLDPCHGWGGRFTGACIADVAHYVGCDPSEEAHAGLERMAEAFLPYCPETKADFLLSPFEDADLCGQMFDFALTSPPYFDVEQYHGENQSHVRFTKYDIWCDGFYRTLIEKTYHHLKDGAVFALNVGGKSYPLIRDGQDIARSVGFRVEDVRPLGCGTASALHNNSDTDEDNEKIIILRK